ncbi:hypothetical protein BT69DRAFT_1288597 [Atractiella rhizophila]|nr:hypothetical protein BT69DRAFT_1288597 [Atractiella rhizophila]
MVFSLPSEDLFTPAHNFSVLRRVMLDGGHENSSFIDLPILSALHSLASVTQVRIHYCNCTTPDAISVCFGEFSNIRNPQYRKQLFEIKPFIGDWDFDSLILQHRIPFEREREDGDECVYVYHGESVELRVIDVCETEHL